MNRNEKIVKLLEDNGFKSRNHNLVKVVKIREYKTRELLGHIDVTAYCTLNMSDMKYSSVNFVFESFVCGDLAETNKIINSLSTCYKKICNLKNKINKCVGDEEQ